MVRMIMALVQTHSFSFIASDRKQSKLRRLKNGVPQGLVLTPLLFNICTYDLSFTIFKKFVDADDVALSDSSENCKDLEGTLSQDISILSSPDLEVEAQSHKAVTAAFHLNYRLAKRELKVYNNYRSIQPLLIFG